MSRKAIKDRSALEECIGYKFADKALLERALTHISALSGGPQNRAASYQRQLLLGAAESVKELPPTPGSFAACRPRKAMT